MRIIIISTSRVVVRIKGGNGWEALNRVWRTRYCLYISIFSIINLIHMYRVHTSWKKLKTKMMVIIRITFSLNVLGRKSLSFSCPPPFFWTGFSILSLLYYVKTFTFWGPFFSPEHIQNLISNSLWTLAGVIYPTEAAKARHWLPQLWHFGNTVSWHVCQQWADRKKLYGKSTKAWGASGSSHKFLG